MSAAAICHTTEKGISHIFTRLTQPRLVWTVTGIVLWTLFSLYNMGQSASGERQGARGATLTQIFTEVNDLDPGGRFSPDGKFFAGTDWNTGNLTVRAISTGRMHALTDTNWTRLPYAFAMWPAWSPDGMRIAYAWYAETFNLRVVARTGGESRVIFTSKEEPFVPTDWSADGNLILGVVGLKDNRKAVGTVSSRGEMTVLRTLNAESPLGLRFSPDGRFVAYDATVDGNREIYVLSLRAMTETRITENRGEDDSPIWSPDGGYLLYRSDQAGRRDLWGLPVREGKPAGREKMVYPDFGETTTVLGWLPGERLAYSKQVSWGTLYTVPLDISTGAVLGQPYTPVPQFSHQHITALGSPDGKCIALVVASGKLCLATKDSQNLESLSTHALAWFQLAGWFPQNDALALSAWAVDGKMGVFRLALTGGEPEAIHEDPLMNWSTGQLSPQGSAVAYFRRGEKGEELCAYDLGQSKMLRVFELASDEGYWGLRWLPDGKALIYVSERDNQLSRLVQVPLPTGAPTELLTSKEIVKYPTVSPNGRYLAYVEFPRKSPPGLTGEGSIRLVRMGRSEPKQIRLPSGHRPFQLTWSARGNELTYISREVQYQFWSLSDFLARAD